MGIDIDLDKLSNLGIPIITLIGTGYLWSIGKQIGWGFLVIGFVWWGIDQIVKWKRLKKLKNEW